MEEQDSNVIKPLKQIVYLSHDDQNRASMLNEPDSQKKYDKKLITDLKATVKIRFVDNTERVLAVNIIVYLDRPIKNEIEIMPGIVQEFVQAAIIALPSPVQTMILDYEGILNWLPSPGAIIPRKNLSVHWQSSKEA